METVKQSRGTKTTQAPYENVRNSSTVPPWVPHTSRAADHIAVPRRFKIHCADMLLQRHQVTFIGARVARAGVNSEAAGQELSFIVQKHKVELGEEGRAIDCAWEKNEEKWHS